MQRYQTSHCLDYMQLAISTNSIANSVAASKHDNLLLCGKCSCLYLFVLTLFPLIVNYSYNCDGAEA